MRPNTAPAGVVELAGRQQASGSGRLTLRPLEDSVAIQIVGDVVDADPTTGLVELARRAEGNPRLLVVLVEGLIQEEAIRVDNGVAELLEGRLPRRVVDLVREQLVDVSPSARRTAAVLALLGEAASFEHAATMLQVAPASLLEPVEELVLARVLTHGTHNVGFANELTRLAVIDTVPWSGRAALRRDAIEVLLAAGASPAEPALDLARTAKAGDRAAAATLVAAAQAVVQWDVATAAELSLRAVDLTAATDLERGARVALAALLLHEADRTAQAQALAQEALRGPLAPQSEAEIRLSVAQMSALSPARRVEAGRAALALPDITPSVRVRHLVQLTENLIEAGHRDEASSLVAPTLEAVADSHDREASARLTIASSQLLYAENKLDDARQLVDAACADMRHATELWSSDADRWRAEVALDGDDFEFAQRAGTDGAAAALRRRHDRASRSWERFSGRISLRAGRISDALWTLGGVPAEDDEYVVQSVDDVMTLAALGRIAIHSGDHRGARRAAVLAEHALTSEVLEIRRHAAWFLLLFVLALGDASDAQPFLALMADETGAWAMPQQTDIADYSQLVRVALRAGENEIVAAAIAAVEDKARRNPAVISIAATSAHARGLVSEELAALEEATRLFAGSPRLLALASAHEDHGVALVRTGDREGGISELGNALQIYSSAGAVWDAARTRRRLRELGVRRRLLASSRPRNGWAGLTNSELAVATLVAEGLTNRQVAQRLFVSPHTVSMHLRRAFTKLDINSRVELTRLALVQAEAA
jgi:DNA-binding CsgD family transcriptional regulator